MQGLTDVQADWDEYVERCIEYLDADLDRTASKRSQTDYRANLDEVITLVMMALLVGAVVAFFVFAFLRFSK